MALACQCSKWRYAFGQGEGFMQMGGLTYTSDEMGVGNCWLMQAGIELVVFLHRLILVN